MVLHYDGEVQIVKLQVGPYGNNCYIIICPTTRECAIIDTPPEPEKVLAELKGLKPKGIFITHNHFDHLEGYNEIKRGTGAPAACHQADAGKLPSPPQILFQGGEEFPIGSLPLRAIHTPGHTPGASCFLVGRHLFSGDTLFPKGPGRTSSPDNFRQIVGSITRRLFVLPDDTLVYPGHGEDTVLRKEKEEHRVFSQRTHPPDLCGDVLWLSP